MPFKLIYCCVLVPLSTGSKDDYSEDSEDDSGTEKENRHSEKTKHRSTKNPTEKPRFRATSVTPGSSSSKKAHRPDIELEDHFGSDSEEELLSSSTGSGKSKDRRRSAGTTQQIQELTAQYRKEMVTKTAKERKLEKEKQELEDRLAEMEAERDAAVKKQQTAATGTEGLVRQYQQALAKSTGKSVDKASKNKGMVMQVKKVAKKKLWRTVKFIGNDSQLDKATDMTLKLMKLKDYQHEEDETEEKRLKIDLKVVEFRGLYRCNVRCAINDQRSYVQGEMKKFILIWQKDGNELLCFDDFKSIAMRNVVDEDGNEDPDKVKQFDLYLMLLSACAGSHTFGEKQRRLVPVSDALTEEGKTAVPPSTEAVCLVLYDNCVDKWREMHNYKEVEKKTGDIPKYSSKRHEETKQWKAKYSDSCSGNSPYGGWNKEGLVQFNTVKKEISNLRANKKEEILVVEKAAVKRFYALWLADRKRKAAENGRTIDDEDLEELAPSKKQKSGEDEVLAEFDEEE